MMRTLLDLFFDACGSNIFNSSSGMMALPCLREVGQLERVKNSIDFNSVTFCKALCEVIRDKLPGGSVRVVQLDNNKIRKFSVILDAFIAADLHQGITAISVVNNEITDFQFLGPLKRFPNLHEVVLNGNSLCNEASYSSRITRGLPGLMLLDGCPVERNLLTLQNPIVPALNSNQETVVKIIEDNIIPAMTSNNFEGRHQMYHSQAILSFSTQMNNQGIPQQLPFEAKLNSATLTPELRRGMKADFNQLRNRIRWRNLSSDPNSIRNVTYGREKVIVKLMELCGGGTLPIYLEIVQRLANVEFIECMPVPVCIVTTHSSARFYWNPSKHHDLQGCPFISCFMDRTLSLTFNEASGWSICNDMIHLRQDSVVVTDDGAPMEPLFDAFSTYRKERLRRRVFHDLPPEQFQVMLGVMTQRGIALSDYNVQYMAQLIKSANYQEVMHSPADFSNLINFLCEQQQ